MKLKSNDAPDFSCRTFGKSELAHCYCPELTLSSARRKLIQWIESVPGLCERLSRLGYKKECRVLSPAMVAAIVEAVGDP